MQTPFIKISTGEEIEITEEEYKRVLNLVKSAFEEESMDNEFLIVEDDEKVE